MKLFEMVKHDLRISPEVWGLLPFKKLLDRDKTKGKELAFKEMLFIFYYCDIRSDYSQIIDDQLRLQEIKRDINLPEKWKIDEDIKEAIRLYEKHAITAIGRLYKSSLKAANDVAKYLENTEILLAERTMNGGLVTKINDITNSLAKVPKIMQDLKSAYKEVVAEQKEMEGRTKGSKTLGFYEDGLKFD